tara:strand:+ start:7028 stop:7207 length:180 start_codon:yes stop_codon:yes gene_type:complete
MRKNILVKRAEAKERQSLRNKLTPEQQLARLDKKLGVDIGAARERARLKGMIFQGSKKK